LNTTSEFNVADSLGLRAQTCLPSYQGKTCTSIFALPAATSGWYGYQRELNPSLLGASLLLP